MKVKFKEVISGCEKVAHKSRFSAKARVKIIVISVLVAVFVSVYLLSSFGIIPMAALGARIESTITQSDKNFPVSLSSIPLDVKGIGDGVIFLFDDSVSVYSGNGELRFQQPHSYKSPVVSVNGDRAVVFDRGDVGYMLLTDNKYVSSNEYTQAIYCAEYGKKDVCAIGSRCEDATSMLTVFSKSGQILFQWKSAYDYISQIALSDNGKFAGVTLLGAENGETVTTVKYFGFDYSEPLSSSRIKGAAPMGIEFTKINLLTVFTDTGIHTLGKGEEDVTTVTDYYSTEFNSYFVNESGRYAVSLARYGSENDHCITLYNSNGTEKTSVSVDFSVNSVYLSDKYIFALAEKQIKVYNLRGKAVSTIVLEGECKKLVPDDDYVYVVFFDNVKRCYSYGDCTVASVK